MAVAEGATPAEPCPGEGGGQAPEARPVVVDTPLPVALDDHRSVALDDPQPVVVDDLQSVVVDDPQSVVLDIAGLALEDVAALPDSVLGALLRRVHDSCAAGDPFVTGHTESA
ncbi:MULTISPECIES: FxSxx-COOH cyclophane-containing RiPP peptide [Streptomyces]|uniref:FXSXX-COOH protein n=1 Tax=Streptomyces dengpaensis TaxID=2049881 RepID=A0ABM6SY77_9ACTN|nr:MULTISPECIES: FxSxx-COOH cyclophane-containing RiPP peptide [Streptomyces]AVH59649.1 FXSXX-COOH protein [Streptomyces dengpaensis]PIB06916.1 FXSXX-COOH protein [Streptomyces sp. HG99]